MNHRNAPHAALLAICLAAAPAFAAGTFTDMGSGKAFSISSDGSTIVGQSNSQAAKWETSGFTRYDMGFLGGDSVSIARDVSADGSVIVGASGTRLWDPNLGAENSSGYFSVGEFDDAQGVRWAGSGTSYSPTVLIGLNGGQGFTQAYGVSADGNVVVGSADQNYNPYNVAANENGNATDLTYDQTSNNFNSDGTPKASPYDPSTLLNDQWRTGVRWDFSSGQTVSEVGPGKHPDFNPLFDPGEPVSGSGTPEDKWKFNTRPTYTPPFQNYADWFFSLPTRSTNSDGSMAVGWSQGPAGTNSSLWDQSTGETKIMSSLAYGRSWAQRMTDNGKYIVGGSWGDGAGGQDTNRVPYRWTKEAQMQALPFLNPPGSGGQASGYTEMFGVSENGWFAVGAGNKEVFVPPFFTFQRSTAVIWDEINGTQELATFLTNHGVTGFSGWWLKRATDIIYDNVNNTLTIIGYGNPSGGSGDLDPQTAFHVTVDNILSRDDYVPGDADVDGDVDMDDLTLIAASWKAKGFWGNGDFNGDGRVNVVDLGLTATNWQYGVAASSTMSFEQAWALVVPVPEPAAALLLAIGAMPLLGRRGRAR